jgi:hypothetical protein
MKAVSLSASWPEFWPILSPGQPDWKEILTGWVRNNLF